MTAHSISISSELKMSSFGLYTGAKELRYQLHGVEGCANVQQFLNIVNSSFVHMLLDKAVNKQIM